MPLTPLHLAVALPVRKHISMPAFILVNILIDLEPGLIMFFGMDGLGYPLHQGVHTLGGATLMIATTTLAWPGFKAIPFKHWFLGALLGGYSHILLDALVHSDVNPLGPILQGNPIFLDAHAEVSIACAVLLSYYLAKWVESLRIGEVAPAFIKRIWGSFLSRFFGK